MFHAWKVMVFLLLKYILLQPHVLQMVDVMLLTHTNTFQMRNSPPKQMRKCKCEYFSNESPFTFSVYSSSPLCFIISGAIKPSVPPNPFKIFIVIGQYNKSNKQIKNTFNSRGQCYTTYPIISNFNNYLI